MATRAGIGHHDRVATSTPGDLPRDPQIAARAGRRPRDMALSLLVLLAPILLIVGAYRVLGLDTEVTTIDPVPTIRQAQADARFTVVEPRGLSTGWRVTSAATARDGAALTLRIGYVTPEDGRVQLLQSDFPVERLLADDVGAGARPAGEVTIANRTWQRYPGRGKEQALVLMEPDRTTIVVGTASDTELRTLVNSLS